MNNEPLGLGSQEDPDAKLHTNSKGERHFGIGCGVVCVRYIPISGLSIIAKYLMCQLCPYWCTSECVISSIALPKCYPRTFHANAMLEQV